MSYPEAVPGTGVYLPPLARGAEPLMRLRPVRIPRER